MAIVDKIRPETIEKLRGVVDFYMLRGILPVARSWPKKPKPPYTAIQAESMAVFKIAQETKRRISPDMLEAWRKQSFGKKEAWGDTFTRLIMEYWKEYRVIAPIAIDYKIEETETEFWVEWTGLRVYLDKEIEEVIRTEKTLLIAKDDISKMHKPIYIKFIDEYGKRLIAPFILFEV